nr:CPBP family intramembrane glutamic endopeptidase [Wenzhouxiangella sp. XN79A]
MLLGTALFEESFFRGFLLPQLYLRLGVIASERMRLAAAVVISALVFSPWHLPTLLINQDLEPTALFAQLVNLFGAGVLLAVLYLRTGNLWVTMAVHALVNAPTLLLASPVSGSMLAGTLGVALIIAWPRFIGRPLAMPLLRFEALD